MRFRDIKEFPRCAYHIDVEWRHLEQHIRSHIEVSEGMAPLDLEPDFQRAHVWTRAQQIAYVEYALRGGQSGRDLYLNCAGWMEDWRGPYVIVDGKQRIQAVRRFMASEIPAFGCLYKEFEDHLRSVNARFFWNVAALETRAEVLRWYLDFNSGGTQHTRQEIARVKDLLAKEG